MALPLLLYVPFIQDAVFPFALRKVSGMTGMEITADRLRLQWPLRVTASGVMIVNAPGDTMAVARNARLQVEPLPLLGLDIRAEGDLDGIRYRLGTPDSAMYLQAVVDRFRLLPSGYNLRDGHISISRAELDGADVLLLFNGPDTTATPPDTAAATALTIDASLLSLRNVRYRMAMLPVIDSLDVTVPAATLADGHLDMLSHTIHARSLHIDSVSATYLTPSAEYLKTHPADSTLVDASAIASTPDSLMWTITGDSLRLTARDAIYAMRGAVPAPGLDMNYLAVSHVDLCIDSLYNRGAAITVPLRRLSATERCGLRLDASGTFAMDSTVMRASGFSLSTIYSSAEFDAMMGMGDIASDPSLPLSLRAKAAIGLPDLAMAFPAMRTMLDALPQSRDIELQANADGTVGRLSVDRLSVAMRDYFNIEASGHVADAMNPDNLSGHIDIDGSLPNVQFARNIALTPAMAKEISIPPLTLDGSVDMKRGVISGDLAATVDRTGDMLLRAMWNGRATDYDVTLSLDRFPVASIMPSLGVGDITASVSAEGHGLDITSTRTRLKAEADVASIVFNKKTYTDLKAWASLADGEIKGGLLSLNHDAAFDLDLSGTVAGGVYDVAFDGDVHNLDLKALGMTPDECRGTFGLDRTHSARQRHIRCHNERKRSGLDNARTRPLHSRHRPHAQGRRLDYSGHARQHGPQGHTQRTLRSRLAHSPHVGRIHARISHDGLAPHCRRHPAEGPPPVQARCQRRSGRESAGKRAQIIRHGDTLALPRHGQRLDNNPRRCRHRHIGRKHAYRLGVAQRHAARRVPHIPRGHEQPPRYIRRLRPCRPLGICRIQRPVGFLRPEEHTGQDRIQARSHSRPDRYHNDPAPHTAQPRNQLQGLDSQPRQLHHLQLPAEASRRQSAPVGSLREPPRHIHPPRLPRHGT